MSNRNWANRERKASSKQHLKNLGKPFRRSIQKDSQQAREWSKMRKKLQRIDDQEVGEVSV